MLKSASYPYNTVRGKDFLVGNFGLRFHFNGQETDDEIAGKGNINTAEFWEYDTRLGRRWNVDPVDKPWISSYHAFSNKPIWNIDPNGANDGIYLVDEETGEKTKVSNQGDDEGYDIIHTGKINEDGSMSEKNTKSTVFVDKGITQTLTKDGKAFDPTYHSYGWTPEENTKACNFMLSVTLGVMTGGLSSGGGLLANLGSYGGTATLRGGLDYAMQLAVNNGKANRVDLADVMMTAVFNAKYSALLGSFIDVKNEEVLIAGINKPIKEFGIDLATKFAFGGLGLSGQAQTLLKPLNAPQLNFLFQMPIALIGKIAGKTLKEASDGK